jgi:hypothetical protein
MREIATVLAGIGLLIFAYLIFTQSQGASTVLGSISSLMTNTISVLQGQGSGGGNYGGSGFGSGSPFGGIPFMGRRAA